MAPSASEKPAKRANQRGVARLAAVQALYQMDLTGAKLMDVVNEFENFRMGREVDAEEGEDVYLEADRQWFRAILAGVVAEQKQLDPLIHRNLPPDWPLQRIETLLRSILRAGVWELRFKRDVPARVIINEYVDVTKAFFDEDEPKLVNGLLDRLARLTRDTKADLRKEAEDAAETAPDSGDSAKGDPDRGDPDSSDDGETA